MLQVVLYLILYAAVAALITFVNEYEYIVVWCVSAWWLFVVEDGSCPLLCLSAAEEKEFFYRCYSADQRCEFLCFWCGVEKGLKHTFGFLCGDFVAMCMFFFACPKKNLKRTQTDDNTAHPFDPPWCSFSTTVNWALDHFSFSECMDCCNSGRLRLLAFSALSNSSPNLCRSRKRGRWSV